MRKEFFPGWALMLVIGLVCNYLSALVVIGGKHPIESTALAIVIGVLLRNLNFVPPACLPGIKATEKLLIWGIVLMGASLDFNSILTQGPAILGVILTTMLFGFFVIYALGKLFNLSKSLGLLLAIGTTICGTTAIAISAPIIRANDEETSYAVATIALFGLIAILLYPLLGRMVHADDVAFGVFAGTAIHSTPQVVGAGFIYSDLAGKTATAVKLVRNCFMAPLALILALWFNRKGSGSKITAAEMSRAFPWFLFGYFLMAGLNTKGYFTPAGVDGFSNCGKFLILLAMAGIGLNTIFSAFKSVGLKPLIVGFAGAVAVAVLSAVSIHLYL